MDTVPRFIAIAFTRSTLLRAIILGTSLTFPDLSWFGGRLMTRDDF